jgi:hypothetical protein
VSRGLQGCVAVFASIAVLAGFHGGVCADEAAAEATTVRDRFRGSGVRYRNVASTASFDPALGQTYDPYYAMALQFHPQWWPADAVYLSGSIELAMELTESGQTTLHREALWGDLALALGAPGAWTIPGVGVDVSHELALTLPTSKASRFDTLNAAVTSAVTLSRRFDVLDGLTLQAALGGSWLSHRYTTSENAGDRYPGCSDLAQGRATSPCLNTGVRNPWARTVGSAGVSLDIGHGLSLALGGALVHDFLHPQGTAVRAAGAGGGPGVRYAWGTTAEVAVAPWPGVAFALGASTQTEQLHSDPGVTFRNPVFDKNRTSVFADVRLDLAAAGSGP